VVLVCHFQVGNGCLPDRDTRRLARGVDSPSHTVLVVDDDPSIRFLCRVNLELEGCAVREAGTLAQARTELSASGVDVVLLDVHVGNESGVDFLQELRRDHPDVPVAMLTGSVGTPTLVGAVADAVIPKPFRIDQLTTTVRNLAQRAARPAG
jgi:two-component system nitrogen regulation response regulator NtrX